MAGAIIKKAIGACITLILLAPMSATASDLKAPLPLSRISSVTINGRTATCALFRGRTKWRPAKRVRGSVYKAIRGTRAHRTACSALSNLGTVTLAEIPSTEGMFKSNSAGASSSIFAVSGTPPALVDIPGSAIKNLFWRSGVIDGINSGSPTAEQCNELFDSPSDGQSGGFNACFMTMNAGEAFQTVLRSGTSLCYMKRAISQNGLDTGAVGLVSGSFPGGRIDNVVAPPAGSAPRIIKVVATSGMGDSFIYLRVYSQSANVTNGDSYRFDFWSCDSGDAGPPSEIENTRITTGGLYSSTSQGNSEAAFRASVAAFLTRSGENLVFDVTRSRTAQTEFANGALSEVGKSALEIDGSNNVRVKRYSSFNNNISKSYSIARMDGGSLTELKFLEGAFNEIYAPSGLVEFAHTGGIEYRTSLYVSAPANSFVSELSSVNLNTDSFFSSLTPVSFDSTGYSCSATPDIVLEIDLDDPAFAPIQSACEGTRLENMDFCQDSEVGSARDNFFMHCSI